MLKSPESLNEPRSQTLTLGMAPKTKLFTNSINEQLQRITTDKLAELQYDRISKTYQLRLHTVQNGRIKLFNKINEAGEQIIQYLGFGKGSKKTQDCYVIASVITQAHGNASDVNSDGGITFTEDVVEKARGIRFEPKDGEVISEKQKGKRKAIDIDSSNSDEEDARVARNLARD